MLLLGTLLFSPLPAACADEELILGVFPRRNAMQTVSAFTPLADYLAARLKRPVRLETAGDFDSFWDGLQQGRYDIVLYNQYHYLRSHRQLGYLVIAMNEEFGQSRVRSIVMTRRDSGITTAADLRGKEIVLGGGKHAMLNYIIPTYLLSQAGLKPGDYTEHIARYPGNSVVAVCVGQAVAAGSCDIALRMPQVAERCDTSQLAPLLKSEPMAHLPWAVKGDLPVGLRKQIRQALLDARQTADGRAALVHASLTGLMPAHDRDYDPYRAIVAQVLGEHY